MIGIPFVKLTDMLGDNVIYILAEAAAMPESYQFTLINRENGEKFIFVSEKKALLEAIENLVRMIK